MKPGDFIGAPCSCAECCQAGVTARELRRDPTTGAWLHGYALKRWYEAMEHFKRKARAAVGAPGRHGQGFERLAAREPGQEG